MCYSVYFSTDSVEDFSGQTEYYWPHPLETESDAENAVLLAYPNQWHLSSKYGGCSCHFRHRMGYTEFGPVEDWAPEDEEDVESTRQVYDLLSRILAEGHRIDIADLWAETSPEDVETLEVVLSDVPRDHFLFFENKRFELVR